jgi:hypothetical protein
METVTLTFKAFAGQGKNVPQPCRRPIALGFKQLAQRLHARLPRRSRKQSLACGKGLHRTRFQSQHDLAECNSTDKSVNLGELS